MCSCGKQISKVETHTTFDGQEAHSMACSCGEKKVHEVATRQTFDGKDIRFLSNGGVGNGFWWGAIAGIGLKRLSADRLDILKEETCLFDMEGLVKRFVELHKMDAADRRKTQRQKQEESSHE